jgi:hypothetical protein
MSVFNDGTGGLVMTNYESLIDQNLNEAFRRSPSELGIRINADSNGDLFFFRAFGEDCCLGRSGITLSGRPAVGPKGLLISLYALHATKESMRLEPFKAFKDLPDSMPYRGAFRANSEMILVPHVGQIKDRVKAVKRVFDAETNSSQHAGDLSFILYPLPKIALRYIFYFPDEDFPASAVCLFSTNALSFMPLDGLADVAEYSSRKILEISCDESYDSFAS